MKHLKVIFMAIVAMILVSSCAPFVSVSKTAVETPNSVNSHIGAYLQELTTLKKSVEKTDSTTVTYIKLLMERGNVLHAADAAIAQVPSLYAQWSNGERKTWDSEFSKTIAGYKKAIKAAILDNQERILAYTGSNVETGSGHNLVFNLDFAPIIMASFQKEVMIDFLAFNQKNDVYCSLKADKEKKEESEKVLRENEAHLSGEIIGQKKLAVFVSESFADANLLDVEANTFTSCEKVLKDPNSALKSVVDTLGSAVELLRQHLLYAGGIDMFSGKKVIIPLRESDLNMKRKEFETFMKVQGQESKQKVTFYGVLPKNHKGPLTEDMVRLRVMENSFTASTQEDLIDNNFNKTQLELPEYWELKELFEQKVKEYTPELNYVEQKALATVRKFHDVWITFQAYEKAKKGLDEYGKKEEIIIDSARPETDPSKKKRKKEDGGRI